MTCVKCGSEASIDGVRILDRHSELNASDLTAAAYKDPHALLFKGEVTTTIVARVCGDCGYIELYATDPAALLEVAKRRAGL